MSFELNTFKRVSGDPREFIPVEEARKYDFFQPYIPKDNLKNLKMELQMNVFVFTAVSGVIGGGIFLLTIVAVFCIVDPSCVTKLWTPQIQISAWGGIPVCAGLSISAITFCISSATCYNHYNKEKRNQENQENEIPISTLKEAILNEKNKLQEQQKRIEGLEKILTDIE